MRSQDSSIANSIYLLSKSAAVMTLAVALGLAGYLAYNNPEINYLVNKENIQKEQAEELSKLSELDQKKAWNWKYLSDINVEDNKYPVVLLRYGFKMISYDLEKSTALIGWKYEAVNLSKSRYQTTINFKLTDSDGFEIESSIKEDTLWGESINHINDTISINIQDLNRLKSSDWTLSLSPSWKTKEPLSDESKYQKLEKFFSREDTFIPYWITSKITDESSPIHRIGGSKWKAIKNGYLVQTGEYDFSDAVNPFKGKTKPK